MAPRVLVAGGGIAGLTLAFWLHRRGFEPVVLEIAGGVRGGGYMIDFWGVGFDVAERMGLRDALAAEHIEIPTIDFVDERDRVGAQFDIRRLRELIGWRHFNLMRSGLERVLYDAIKDRVDVRFDRRILRLRELDGGVEVDIAGGGTERFDLVVGADGLRSSLRRELFGDDARFERFLGYYVASYTVDASIARKDAFRLLTVPGKQIGAYAVRGDAIAAYFIFAQHEALGHLDKKERRARLREAFAGVGWEAEALLARLDDATDFYFDAVSQVELPEWSKGRVALVGDACQCVSLISGQGSALAMAGAFVLAAELASSSSHVEAFARYQARMQPEIERKQRSARRFAGSFIPSSRFGIGVRDSFVKLMFVPFLSKLFVRRFLADELSLEEYR